MALTKCRECGKDVSTDAATCPHCGVADPGGTGQPVADRTVKVEERPVDRTVKVEERPVDRTVRVEERPVIAKRGGGFARFLLWVILIIFLVVLAAWYLDVLNFG